MHVSVKLLPFIAICLLACGAADRQQPAAAPNVVFIMADDLGWMDVGFMGGNFFETPQLDALAASGMVFTRAYAAAANCAPSRACLMSGQYPPRHGIYTVGSAERGLARHRKLIPVANTRVLHDSVFTLAELFREAGYATGTFGKWHLGEDPRSQGFEVNAGGGQAGYPGRDGYFSPYQLPFLPDGPPGELLPHRLTSEAIRFMEARRQQPFFLYLPYYSVHTPLMARAELVAKYEQKTPNPKGINPTYAAMVETLDQQVGRILRALDSLGLRQNTLLVFTSDNGGIRAISTQAPLRAGKGSYYEGGIRVPTLISWPGKVQPGNSSDTPIINLDFFPTFMEILGINKPGKLLDGQSLMPLLQGDSLPARPLYWHFPIYLQAYNPQKDDGRDPLFRTRPGAVITLGRWKLHHYYEDAANELYDLQTDPGERHNLAAAMPQKTQELLNQLSRWQQQTHAPIPTRLNPAYQP
ncbi:MAG: DUF4976 domain-containing protein [Bacteroidetes bacterium]|nr:MAG: DUF4976 domain-containing protein [Bacteroidota bacterium]